MMSNCRRLMPSSWKNRCERNSSGASPRWSGRWTERGSERLSMTVKSRFAKPRRKSLFPPRHHAGGENRLRHKAVSHDTVNGVVRIERIRWWSQSGGCDETIDRVLEIVTDSVSVEVRQMCARVGIAPMGFCRAAGPLNHLAQIRISAERLRQITEQEGQRVMAAQSQVPIAVSLASERAKVSSDGPTRIYVGAEGSRFRWSRPRRRPSVEIDGLAGDRVVLAVGCVGGPTTPPRSSRSPRSMSSPTSIAMSWRRPGTIR